MEEIQTGILLDCTLSVIGPRNSSNELANVALAVSRAVAEEKPFHLPDDAERLAGAVSTQLRLDGITHPGDAVAPHLATLIAFATDPIYPFRKQFGLGLTRADAELLLTLIQGKVLEIDAWALEKDCHNKRVDAAEREMLVSLKNRIAETKQRYLKD